MRRELSASRQFLKVERGKVLAGCPTPDSGLELTRRLRDDARTKNAGIIVLTGRTFGVAVEEAKDAGCDRFLLKPCPPDALALEIRDVLSARDTSGSGAHSAFSAHVHSSERRH